MRAENQNRRKRTKRLPPVLLAGGLPMTQQNLLGLVDLRREVGRPSLVGMQLHHQGSVSPADVLFGGPGRKAKNLIGLLFGHLAGPAGRLPASLPRRRTLLRVLTPA